MSGPRAGEYEDGSALPGFYWIPGRHIQATPMGMRACRILENQQITIGSWTENDRCSSCIVVSVTAEVEALRSAPLQLDIKEYP